MKTYCHLNCVRRDTIFSITIQILLYSRGESVLITVSENIKFTIIRPPLNNIEQLFIRIRLQDSLLIISGVYLSSNLPASLYHDHCICKRLITRFINSL